MQKKHLNITISGRVQGVGFRFSAREKARNLGLRGFVKNNYDGSVYIEAEGEPNNVREYVYWCNHGPSSARVEKVNIEEDVVKDFKTFEIRA
ncbi:MAG: acylphosphatase [Bacteroidota bacterium]